MYNTSSRGVAAQGRKDFRSGHCETRLNWSSLEQPVAPPSRGQVPGHPSGCHPAAVLTNVRSRGRRGSIVSTNWHRPLPNALVTVFVPVIISGFFPNLFGAKFRVPGTDGQATNGGARVNSVKRDDDNLATGNVNSVIVLKKEGSYGWSNGIGQDMLRVRNPSTRAVEGSRTSITTTSGGWTKRPVQSRPLNPSWQTATSDPHNGNGNKYERSNDVNIGATDRSKGCMGPIEDLAGVFSLWWKDKIQYVPMLGNV
ncbi:hypothetical protein BC827DRAFT_1154508 [Russula dissimulans]|nr:hypothetical protein BC827DRAFT_1154508 [Russula dissimulans]